jgi:hypothetical protein
MSTGDETDILGRVKRLLPRGWFSYVAPYRDAIIGGLADLGAWSYTIVSFARSQSRLATAYGVVLDIYVYDFLGRFLPRQDLNDNTYRALARATILQERVTRAGMINALTVLNGTIPVVFEPWNTYDTGAYSSRVSGSRYGSMGYGVGRGGYGNMRLPAQTFIRLQRGNPSGVPMVAGWGDPPGGFGAGAIEFAGPESLLSGVTNTMIEDLIDKTKPTGSLVWLNIGGTVPGFRRPAIFNGVNAGRNSQNIAAI